MALPLLYLLDTNILIHFVRADAVWASVRQRYSLFAIEPKPLISVVTAGELRSFAYQRQWGPAGEGTLSQQSGQYLLTITNLT